MGFIVDSNDMHTKFLTIYNQEFTYKTNKDSIAKKKLFVDKSNIINEFNNLINKGNKKNVCITKPRGFGKTAIGAMLVSYYSKGIDCKELFDKLKVSKGKSSDVLLNRKERKQYVEFQNKFHTLYFDFSLGVDSYDTLKEYLASINQKLKYDFEQLYPDSKLVKCYFDQIYDNLYGLYEERRELFILIIDEWDYIITNQKFSQEERDKYISFLKYLIKDRGYIAFTYMTGITPIANQVSRSIINCFKEYSMINDSKYFSYFGFTEQEIRNLCKNNKNITYEKLEKWYGGYKEPNGEKIFNPWSVCQALSKNEICNYWTYTGLFDDLINIVNFNINGMKDEILELVRGGKLSQVVHIYDQRNMIEKSENDLKEELYSKMVIFGFLSYYDGKISIPNKELLNEFILLLKQKKELKYYYDMIENSDDMIKATFTKNTKTMCKILEKLPMEKVMPTDNIDHGNLKRIIDFVYFNIRINYDCEEEETEDCIYYQKKKSETVIIVELKVNGSAKQNHDINYYNNLKIKKGYKRNILLVEIDYQSQNKTYQCRVKEYNCDIKHLSTSKSSSESLNKRNHTIDCGMSKRLRSSDKNQK
jgi:hypothetical protein